VVCTTRVNPGAMPTTKQVRRSVPVPARIAQPVERLAKRRRLSDNRVLMELIEPGTEATRQPDARPQDLLRLWIESKPDIPEGRKL